MYIAQLHGKCKVRPRTGHEGPEGEWMFSSTFSLTSALYRSGWSTPCPGGFTAGDDQLPFVQEDRWALGPVWTSAKNFDLPEFDPWTIQPHEKCTIWNILTRVGRIRIIKWFAVQLSSYLLRSTFSAALAYQTALAYVLLVWEAARFTPIQNKYKTVVVSFNFHASRWQTQTQNVWIERIHEP